MLLTGVRTFGKTGSGGYVPRMGVTPIEELVGGVLSKVPGISGVAERAPLRGNEAQHLSAESQSGCGDDFNPDTWGDTWHVR